MPDILNDKNQQYWLYITYQIPFDQQARQVILPPKKGAEYQLKTLHTKMVSRPPLGRTKNA